MNTKQKIKNIRTDERAISPIIGTILMVAITVIMAAIIANWSSGIKAPEAPKTVGFDILRTTANTVQITITSINPPSTQVDYVNFTQASDHAYNLSLGSPVYIGMTGVFNVTGFDVFAVGTVSYGDGTKKTIYSQNI